MLVLGFMCCGERCIDRGCVVFGGVSTGSLVFGSGLLVVVTLVGVVFLLLLGR